MAFQERELSPASSLSTVHSGNYGNYYTTGPKGGESAAGDAPAWVQNTLVHGEAHTPAQAATPHSGHHAVTPETVYKTPQTHRVVFGGDKEQFFTPLDNFRTVFNSGTSLRFGSAEKEPFPGPSPFNLPDVQDKAAAYQYDESDSVMSMQSGDTHLAGPSASSGWPEQPQFSQPEQDYTMGSKPTHVSSHSYLSDLTDPLHDLSQPGGFQYASLPTQKPGGEHNLGSGIEAGDEHIKWNTGLEFENEAGSEQELPATAGRGFGSSFAIATADEQAALRRVVPGSSAPSSSVPATISEYTYGDQQEDLGGSQLESWHSREQQHPWGHAAGAASGSEGVLTAHASEDHHHQQHQHYQQHMYSNVPDTQVEDEVGGSDTEWGPPPCSSDGSFLAKYARTCEPDQLDGDDDDDDQEDGRWGRPAGSQLSSGSSFNAHRAAAGVQQQELEEAEDSTEWGPPPCSSSADSFNPATAASQLEALQHQYEHDYGAEEGDADDGGDDAGGGGGGMEVEYEVEQPQQDEELEEQWRGGYTYQALADQGLRHSIHALSDLSDVSDLVGVREDDDEQQVAQYMRASPPLDHPPHVLSTRDMQAYGFNNPLAASIQNLGTVSADLPTSPPAPPAIMQAGTAGTAHAVTPYMLQRRYMPVDSPVADGSPGFRSPSAAFQQPEGLLNSKPVAPGRTPSWQQPQDEMTPSWQQPQDEMTASKQPWQPTVQHPAPVQYQQYQVQYNQQYEEQYEEQYGGQYKEVQQQASIEQVYVSPRQPRVTAGSQGKAHGAVVVGVDGVPSPKPGYQPPTHQYQPPAVADVDDAGSLSDLSLPGSPAARVNSRVSTSGSGGGGGAAQQPTWYPPSLAALQSPAAQMVQVHATAAHVSGAGQARNAVQQQSSNKPSLLVPRLDLNTLGSTMSSHPTPSPHHRTTTPSHLHMHPPGASPRPLTSPHMALLASPRLTGSPRPGAIPKSPRPADLPATAAAVPRNSTSRLSRSVLPSPRLSDVLAEALQQYPVLGSPRPSGIPLSPRPDPPASTTTTAADIADVEYTADDVAASYSEAAPPHSYTHSAAHSAPHPAAHGQSPAFRTNVAAAAQPSAHVMAHSVSHVMAHSVSHVEADVTDDPVLMELLQSVGLSVPAELAAPAPAPAAPTLPVPTAASTTTTSTTAATGTLTRGRSGPQTNKAPTAKPSATAAPARPHTATTTTTRPSAAAAAAAKTRGVPATAAAPAAAAGIAARRGNLVSSAVPTTASRAAAIPAAPAVPVAGAAPTSRTTHSGAGAAVPPAATGRAGAAVPGVTRPTAAAASSRPHSNPGGIAGGNTGVVGTTGVNRVTSRAGPVMASGTHPRDTGMPTATAAAVAHGARPHTAGATSGGSATRGVITSTGSGVRASGGGATTVTTSATAPAARLPAPAGPQGVMTNSSAAGAGRGGVSRPSAATVSAMPGGKAAGAARSGASATGRTAGPGTATRPAATTTTTATATKQIKPPATRQVPPPSTASKVRLLPTTTATAAAGTQHNSTSSSKTTGSKTGSAATATAGKALLARTSPHPAAAARPVPTASPSTRTPTVRLLPTHPTLTPTAATAATVTASRTHPTPNHPSALSPAHRYGSSNETVQDTYTLANRSDHAGSEDDHGVTQMCDTSNSSFNQRPSWGSELSSSTALLDSVPSSEAAGQPAALPDLTPRVGVTHHNDPASPGLFAKAQLKPVPDGKGTPTVLLKSKARNLGQPTTRSGGKPTAASKPAGITTPVPMQGLTPTGATRHTVMTGSAGGGAGGGGPVLLPTTGPSPSADDDHQAAAGAQTRDLSTAPAKAVDWSRLWTLTPTSSVQVGGPLSPTPASPTPPSPTPPSPSPSLHQALPLSTSNANTPVLFPGAPPTSAHLPAATPTTAVTPGFTMPGPGATTSFMPLTEFKPLGHTRHHVSDVSPPLVGHQLISPAPGQLTTTPGADLNAWHSTLGTAMMLMTPVPGAFDPRQSIQLDDDGMGGGFGADEVAHGDTLHGLTPARCASPHRSGPAARRSAAKLGNSGAASGRHAGGLGDVSLQRGDTGGGDAGGGGGLVQLKAAPPVMDESFLRMSLFEVP